MRLRGALTFQSCQDLSYGVRVVSSMQYKKRMPARLWELIILLICFLFMTAVLVNA